MSDMHSYLDVGKIVNFLEESEDSETLEVHKLQVTEVNRERKFVTGTVLSDHVKKGERITLPFSRIR